MGIEPTLGMDLVQLGKIVLTVSFVLAVVGAALILAGKGFAPRLPGDFVFRWGNVRVFLPLTSSILLSIVLTLLARLLSK